MKTTLLILLISTSAMSAQACEPVDADRVLEMVRTIATEEELDPDLALAVADVESAGGRHQVSDAGAVGIMQLMPETASDYGVTDRCDPESNIRAGVRYLKKLYGEFDDPLLMLAAYNAGPGRYDDYLETGRALPAETRAYVAALAPLLGGGTASEAQMVAHALPPDWRDAALFVVRSEQQIASGMPGSAPGSAAPADWIIVTPGAGLGGP